MLERRGLDVFKQTLNRSYYGWLPKSWDNNQVRNLLSIWSRNPSLRPLRARFTSRPTLDSVYADAALSTEDEWGVHALFVGLLWEYASRSDRYGLLTTLEEPQIGMPFPIEIDGRLVSQDLANSVREYNAIRPALEASGAWVERLTLGELGAGYGRDAYVFAKAAPGRYLVFDIPPTLHVSQWYLSQVCPEKRLFAFRPFDNFAEIESELANAQIGFFTPNQLELFPADYFTGFISISSLAEMTRGQVDRYKSLIGSRTSRMVYFKQWQQHYNTHDKVQLDADQYTLTGEWTVLARRTDAVQDHFVEQLQGRNGSAAPLWSNGPDGTTAAPDVVERLRSECVAVQRVADERLDVIRELDAACRERLALIERLDARCRQQQQLIAELQSRPRSG